MTEPGPPDANDALKRLLDEGGSDALGDRIKASPSAETSRAVSNLDAEDQLRLMTLLRPERAAALLEELPEAQAVGLIARLPPMQASAVLLELPSNRRADLLGSMDEAAAEAVLRTMAPEAAADARQLAQYPADVAGGLMIREYFAYPPTYTVGRVVEDFRLHADRYRDYSVQYAYVADRSGVLVGVLQLRDLLLAKPDRAIGDLMIREPMSVSDGATLDDLRDFFDRRRLFGVPVVDAARRLVGVVRRSDVEAAWADRTASDYRKSQGIVGGEELRSMPMLLRARRRLGWLSINIVLNLIAASVIALYQQTLASVIALAVFLPIISDMSGCSGSQAVAVSMRELALGLARPADLFRVLRKELVVGLTNGLALGLLLALAAWVWNGNPYFGLVVGTALSINTVVAVGVGGGVPLLLKRFGIDPAVASGPILTTITDLCGFLLVLSFATAMLPWLT